MNNILLEVENLKKMIIDSNEYKNYINETKKLDKNKEINYLINKIKLKQKEIVKKENIKEDTSLDEKILSDMFDKLNSLEEYKNYLKSAKKLNKLITEIQKRFEDCFNEILD